MAYKTREARKTYWDQWYQKNRQRHIKAQRQHQRKIADVMRTEKQKPCADCSIEYPYYVMHYDHVRGEKLIEVSRMRRRFGYQQVLAEIAKCEVVCSNCHAERTHRRACGG